MNEPLHSAPARLGCHPLGRLDVHGMKALLPVLDVKTDRIYDAVSASKRIRNRLLVVNIGLYGLKLQIIGTKLPECPIRMPRRNPNGKSAIAQTPNDAAAEKSGSAEHGDGATTRCSHVSNLQVRARPSVGRVHNKLAPARCRQFVR